MPTTRRNHGVAVAFTLILLCIYAWLLYTSLAQGGAASIDQLYAQLPLFIDTLQLGVSVSVICLLLSFVLLWCLQGLTGRWHTIVFIALLLPIVIPSQIHAVAWQQLLFPDGWVGRLLQNPTLMTNSDPQFAWWLSVLVLSISYYPITLALLWLNIRTWTQHNEQALTLIARQHGQILLVKLRFLQPAITSAMLLTILFTLSDFSVPDLFQIPVYATEVFVQLTAYYDHQQAARLSLIPALLGLCMAVFLTRALLFFEQDAHGLHAPLLATQFKPLFNSRGFAASVIASSWIGLFVILPLVALLHPAILAQSLLPTLQSVAPDTAQGLGFALATSLCLLMLGIFFGYNLAHHGSAWTRLVRILGIMIFCIPSGVLGTTLTTSAVGLHSYFGQPYHYTIYFAAETLRWLPLATEFGLLLWRRIHRNELDAAQLCTVNVIQRFNAIILPRLLPVILPAFLLLFIWCLNEITLTTLLAPPGFSSLLLRIYSTMHYGPASLLADMVLIHLLSLLLFTGLLMGSLSWYTARNRTRLYA